MTALSATPKTSPTTSGLWGWVALEKWLAAKVGIGGAELFAGATSEESRAERIRAAIAAQSLADEVAGHRHGKPQTFAEVFQVTYGVPL